MEKKCGNCPLLHRDIPSLFFDRTQRMLMDKAKQYKDFKELSVIAVSEWIANQARQSILKNTEIKTIYNWVDLESFKIRKVERTEKFVVLGVSAKWIKGSSKLEDFFKLSNMLSSDEEVWLVGEQPPGLQIPSNIVSIPYVKDAVELSRIYNKADVYVHLSREDSFGKVIIEAMACGTPVIVYNSTVYPEIVSNDCGFISDLGDVRQVYNYIKKVKAMGKDYFLDKCLCRARKYEKNNIINETFSYYLQKASMGRSQNDSISH